MKKYVVRENVPDSVSDSLNSHSSLVQKLLFHRGITTVHEAQDFLKPDYDLHQHDPYLIDGMGRAVDRVLKALKKSERIAVYSDYDHDGGPGGVILHDFFKKIGFDNFENYIPHRHFEGYGVNSGAIEALAERGAKLIITVDVGITDVEAIHRANELGIDVIITDHHLPSGILPSAFAILNSKLESDNYPYDMLCGAGVAFKLVQALIRKGDFGIKEGWEKWLLDLVGIATIADMVPLNGENRVFAHYGLKVLRKSPRPGIKALCEEMKINKMNITEDDIGFMIAPRLNAASRMDTPRHAFELLATKDEAQAYELAKHLHKLNDERKGVAASMVREIKGRIKKLSELPSVLVMGNPEWRSGLLGLAANSIVDTYNRPVFLWARENGKLKGSCRSDGTVNLVELMESIRESFLDLGGHAFSGGFAVALDDIHTLEEKLSNSYLKLRDDSHDSSVTEVDADLTLDEINWRTYKEIEKLAPFGVGNEKPVFMFRDMIPTDVALFGKRKDHLRIDFRKSDGKKVSAIGFFAGPDTFGVKPEQGMAHTLIANMEKSMFRNFPELRLRIVDII